MIHFGIRAVAWTNPTVACPGSYLWQLAEDFPAPNADTDPDALRALLDKSLPMFSPLIDDKTLEAVALKPVSRLPAFRFVGPQLHVGKSTLLIGDAVHTVKPYFGLGANSALEDVMKLSSCIDKHAEDGVGEVSGKGVAGTT